MIKTAFRFLFFLLLCSPIVSFAQSHNPWTFQIENAQEKSNALRKIIPDKYKVVALDINSIENLLHNAPNRFSGQAKQNAIDISFPLADGTFESFRVVRADVLHPDLAARFPEIRSYAGYGIKDAAAFIRFDITPAGLHAVIYSSQYSSIYIDPYMEGNRSRYVSYYTKDYHRKNKPHFVCGVGDQPISKQTASTSSGGAEKSLIGDCMLRKYRLALACTGEYAQFHGGTIGQVLAAMNTSMMRVNGVYEREASITMEIIPNNDEIIFLDAGTDPYTNNNGNAMLDQNQTTINNIIGIQNYDIGHVFSTGGGGIASLRAPCTSRKAMGVTGRGSPVGDFFDIDYVAHEMGHQFGGNHTQNNNCNSVEGYSSVEPGSASTIMGYAGICSPDVQSHSDDYFHVFNLREISDFVVNGSGDTCPEKIDLGNSPPTADAGANYTIPNSTPFELTGSANDADNPGAVTYCWEQMDAEIASMPPVSSSSVGPLFRSYLPTPSPTRIFPPIDNIVNNSTATWDVLPSVGRTMNFTLSVRDNHFGGGCVADDDMIVTVAGNAGPFLVSAPNTNEEWNVGTTQTVSWDVSNTNSPPVNCTNVDIFLSIDGGYTYPITLAENVPNTGSATIITPDNIGSNNRVKIKGHNNVFFDISDENFTISPALIPDFNLEVSPGVVDICQGETASFEINIQTFVNFSEDIAFSVNGLPSGVIATFSPETISGAGSVQLTISNFEMVETGSYDLEIVGTAASVSKSEFITINLTTQAPGSTTLISPSSGSAGLALPVELTWQAVEDVLTYQIEVASSPSFEAGSILFTPSSITPNYTLQTLNALTIYYWRVKAINNCGESAFSATYSFQTQGVDCQNFFSIESVEISADGTPSITSSIEVNNTGNIIGLSVQELSILHSWVGDLEVSLSTPQGSSLALFDRPGFPAANYGCDGNDILVDFTDDAPNTATDFENTCGGNSPSIEGFYQPLTPFPAIYGQEMQGTWTLNINDTQNNDGGQLESWGLEICYGLPVPSLISLAQNTLTLFQGEMAIIDDNYLSATADNQDDNQLIYLLISLPANGTLSLDGMTLSIGDSFTQADVNNGLINYTHDNSLTTTDNFIFDLTGNANSWSGNHTFNIIIEQAVFSATLTINNEITCYNQQNGSITATTENGMSPFTYSLNGGTFQSEATFDNLDEGDYTITVKDADGVEAATNTITLTNPLEITASNTVMGSQINVQASGGTGIFQYSLNGSPFQSESIFSNADIGPFSIEVMDENGCSAITTGNIIDTSLSASATITEEVSCYNEQDGVITVVSSGGTPPLEYSMDGTNFQSNNVFENLVADTYTFTVKDANDISFTTPAILLDNPPALDITYTIDANHVTVNGTGGTGTIRYAIDGGIFALDNVFNNLNNGEHIISIKDDNGCQISESININIIISASISTGIITCFNGSDGTLSITEVDGGEMPYTYQLDDGDFQDSNTFENLPAGDYSITIQDANGQAYTLSGSLGNPAPIIINPILNGNELTIEATGPAPFMYSIDGGGTFNNDNIFPNLENGSYDIVVTNANDCSAMTTFVINNITEVNYETAIVPWCSQNPNDGQITILGVTGGISPYTYSMDQVNFQESNVFDHITVGSQILTVKDSQGSIFEQSITFGDPVGINMDLVFDGETLTLDVSPPSDYTYSIDGGITFQAENTFQITAGGTYVCVAVDGVGCEVSETIVIDGSNELEENQNFSIFPNPNKGSFYIALNHPTRQRLTIEVYDMLGRKVLHKEVEKQEEALIVELSLKTVSPGTYLIKLNNETLHLVKSILVIK